jgi:serine/threonine protein kinase
MSTPAVDRDVSTRHASSGAAELIPGSVLQGGRYVVGPVLGRGGFGITYATHDRRLGRDLAVKELFPASVVRNGGVVTAPPHAAAAFAEAKTRFLREASVLAHFSHPGIVRVFEVFEENGTAYLVMELLEGRTLADIVGGSGVPFQEAEVLDLARRCAQALTVVHHAGVLHRDLNPSNVMVTKAGRVVLIDFGLAAAFTLEQTGFMTRMVTPGYAPPEQYLGEARFGPASDVYGLAATLYRLLAGRAPVSALDRQNGTLMPSVRACNPDVRRLVSDGILDGMELQASHRPQTVAAFVARLGLGEEAVLELSTTDVGPLSPWAPTAAAGPRHTSVLPRPEPPPAPEPRPFQPVKVHVPAPDAGPRPPPGAPVFVPPPKVEIDPSPRIGWPVAPPAVEAAPGSWKVIVPVLAAVAAFGAAAPVLAALVLALVALPAVATAGDGVAFVQLRRQGADRMRWLHRVALPGYLPARFVRNVAGVLYAVGPALVLAGVVVAITLLLDAAGVSRATQELVLRPGGVAAALLLTVPVVRNRRRFRAATVADWAIGQCVGTEGRLTQAGIAVWVTAAVAAVAGFGFRPELWPLR